MARRDLGIGGHGRAKTGSVRKRVQPNQEADRNALTAMGDKDVPVAQRIFGEGHFCGPISFKPTVAPMFCWKGFRMVQSPMWEINPVLCGNVIVRGIEIDSHGPNNDGCDPESMRWNVHRGLYV